MWAGSLPLVVGTTAIALCTAAAAQPVDLRAGLPNWGTYAVAHHYLPDWQGTHLPTTGDHWTWALDSLNWIFESEHTDTVWHHSATVAPNDGGAFSIFHQRDQRFTFHHLLGDTLVQDSAWVLTDGTTEVGYPAVPLCWHGQNLGDTLWYFDQVANMQRMTSLRATLSITTPWGTMDGLLVFEDRILDIITYRIHRRDDLVRELARCVVLDGLYVSWPTTPSTRK